MKVFTTMYLTLAFITILANAAYSQEDYKLNNKEKRIAIDSINSKLAANYIFPEVAEQMADRLDEQLKKGKYNSIGSPEAFAGRLTEDLQSVSHDKHLRVMFNPEAIAEQNQAQDPDELKKLEMKWVEQMKRNNFGFREVSLLEGNVGYLDLRGFNDTRFAGETAVAAMNFLSNASALIIDLRKNGGGNPNMIQLISSYLFEGSVHLNNFYWRPQDLNTQTWTLPHVQGKRSPDTPVYVLTSGNTFSAAEEFSYNLKNMERAVLVGETTGGGAHPGGTIPATDQFLVWIPQGRAINPITNTNWEGIGVSPHVEVSAEKALNKAHEMALDSLQSVTDDDELTFFYAWHATAIKAKNNPVTVSEEKLKLYTGNYGPRKVTLENGTLHYQRDSGTKYTLIPLTNELFMLDGLSYFRLEFIPDGGKVVAVKGHYDDGRTDSFDKE